MEDGMSFPQDNDTRTWEVWLRKADAIDHLVRLREFAPTFDLAVGQQFVTFVDRTVVHVRGSATNLARSVEILGMIAELHAPKTTAAFFTDLDGKEQTEWVRELADRIVLPPANAPFVCLFDTGVSHPHPLLSKLADAADRHTYKPAWGLNDSDNHGTPMAGLACYGDLTGLLESANPVQATHRLESVKVIHKPDPHDPDLYGAVTQESTYRVEVIPDRQRVFCMAVTSTDGRARGKPSSWSAAVDSLASGAADEQRRLFILSAGNTDPAQRANYPYSNFTDSIHDPAQAWNAVTVGGYTDKTIVDAVQYPGWTPLAAQGDLSPSSCTATTWQARWPIKPDIVLEAGNMARNPAFAHRCTSARCSCAMVTAMFRGKRSRHLNRSRDSRLFGRRRRANVQTRELCPPKAEVVSSNLAGSAIWSYLFLILLAYSDTLPFGPNTGPNACIAPRVDIARIGGVRQA